MVNLSPTEHLSNPGQRETDQTHLNYRELKPRPRVVNADIGTLDDKDVTKSHMISQFNFHDVTCSLANQECTQP